MRVHPSREKHERLLAMIKDYEGYGAAVELKLSIDGVDVSERLGAGSRQIEPDTNPTISLGCTLDGLLPTSLFGGPARFYCDVDGIEYDLLQGVLSWPIPKPGFETDLVATSPGGLLSKAKMRPNNTTKNLTEYNGWSPQRVIRDAVGRCAGVGGYDRGQIRSEHFDLPTLYYRDDTGFEDESHPMEALDAVAEEVNPVYRDTPTLGFEAISDPLTGENSEIVWEYEVDSPEVFEWTPPALLSPDDQYTEVVVRDKLEGGSYRVYAKSPVNRSGFPYPLFEGQTFYVPFSDETGAATTSARQLAVDQARAFASPAYETQPLVAFNPFLQKGDVVQFSEDYRDQTGLYRRVWRAVVVATSDPFDLYTIATALSLRLYQTRVTALSDPIVLLPGVSAGTVSAGVFAPPFGVDERGLWIDPERAINAAGVFWAGEDEGGMWVDPDLAGAIMGEDGGGLWIDALDIRLLAVGADEVGTWIDPDLALNSQGQRWAGEDEGGLWVDEALSEGYVGIDGGGLHIDEEGEAEPPAAQPFVDWSQDDVFFGSEELDVLFSELP
jgi:hypothetical protein